MRNFAPIVNQIALFMDINCKDIKMRKLLAYFLFLIFCLPLCMCETSCQASYRNIRKVTKKQSSKNHARQKSYRKHRSAKAKSTRPINTSYVLKSKRRNTYHY